jgi:hypothetical protein
MLLMLLLLLQEWGSFSALEELVIDHNELTGEPACCTPALCSNAIALAALLHDQPSDAVHSCVTAALLRGSCSLHNMIVSQHSGNKS